MNMMEPLPRDKSLTVRPQDDPVVFCRIVGVDLDRWQQDLLRALVKSKTPIKFNGWRSRAAINLFDTVLK